MALLKFNGTVSSIQRAGDTAIVVITGDGVNLTLQIEATTAPPFDSEFEIVLKRKPNLRSITLTDDATHSSS